MKKVPLNNANHKDLKVINGVDCSLFGREYLLPVNVIEFSSASEDYPIVFVKNGQTGQFQSVALMGTEPGENLYCNSNEWAGTYVPDIMKNTPFSLGANQANKDEYFLCINENSPQLSTDFGEALFDRDGQKTSYLRGKTEAVVCYKEQADFTAKFIAYLAGIDLLSAMSLAFNSKGQPGKIIGGIYVVDVEKLKQLPHGELKKLEAQGAMPVLYVHINSLQRIECLGKRKTNATVLADKKG